MFFNTTESFFASCICNKLQHLNNKFQKEWENEKCNSCDTRLIIYKKKKIIFNFNENMYLATCECNKIKCLKDKIVENWYSRRCESCKSNLKVYNDKHIQIKQENNCKKIFNCSCECGNISYNSNLINLKWPDEKCDKCDKKLVVKNNQDQILVNFNFETFNARSQCLFVSVCSCGSLHYESNYILKRWKSKKCNLCKSNLVVYHTVQKTKVIDYTLETSENLYEYLDRIESVKYCSLLEIENQYRSFSQ
jgi:hypothetical protein